MPKLYSAFKVASFAFEEDSEPPVQINENEDEAKDWTEIIPEYFRATIEQEDQVKPLFYVCI